MLQFKLHVQFGFCVLIFCMALMFVMFHFHANYKYHVSNFTRCLGSKKLKVYLESNASRSS